MSMDAEGPGGDSLTYTFRPSVLGAPWEFTLSGDRLAWAAGRRTGSVALRDIRRVRLSFRPANMVSQRYVTEVWSDNAPKLRIVSISWKSMVEQERLDRPYVAFVRELHRRIAQSGATPRFERGIIPLLYWLNLLLFAVITLGLLLLIGRALQAGVWGGAAFAGVFLIFLGWQHGKFLRRNVPGIYSPDALPAALLPKL
jgi:hypothetical protein